MGDGKRSRTDLPKVLVAVEDGVGEPDRAVWRGVAQPEVVPMEARLTEITRRVRPVACVVLAEPRAARSVVAAIRSVQDAVEGGIPVFVVLRRFATASARFQRESLACLSDIAMAARLVRDLRLDAPPPLRQGALLRCGGIALDRATREAKSRGVAVHLTRAERAILERLMSQPEAPVPTGVLYECCHPGSRFDGSPAQRHRVAQTVSGLRKALGPEGETIGFVRSRGGYRIFAQEPPPARSAS